MREAHELGRGACRGICGSEHARHLQVAQAATRSASPPNRTMPALFLAFVLGGVTGWWIHATMSSRQPPEMLAAPSPLIAPSPSPSAPLFRQPEPIQPDGIPASEAAEFDPIVELRRHRLRLPLDGAAVAMMRGGFAAPRKGEPRGHEAVDLLAPRHTPVRAVEDGTIVKLFFSKAGGNTIYHFEPDWSASVTTTRTSITMRTAFTRVSSSRRVM